MSRAWISFVALFFFSLVLGFTTPQAQTATAQINGTVHDPGNASIPGASVTATQVSTGAVSTVTTTGEGLFAFPSLRPGIYDLSVDSNGFSPYRQTQIVLNVGQQLNLDISLKIGGVDQTVTVSAAAVAVDGTSPTQQNTIDQKTVQDLPLNGRNPASLTYTVAGVNDAGLNTAGNTASTVNPPDVASPGESAPSVHGARPGGTYFSLDGASNTDPDTIIGGPFPNPDATGEFSVVTGTYGARYVSAPGGAVNIVTRSGTNSYHGSVFEFIRNGYFNARNALSATPDILKRNQFGGAIGGPVVRDRLFFFGSYQGSIIRNSITGIDFVPTAAERTGNFGTFQIPAAFLSPAIQKFLKNLPLGDPTSGRLAVQTPNNSTGQQGVLKLDYILASHRLFARAFYDRYVLEAAQPTVAAGALSEAAGYVQPWSSYAVGDTWTKGKFLFDTRASFVNMQAKQTTAPVLSSYSNLGITGMSGLQPNPGYAFLYVLNGFQYNNGELNRSPRKETEISEDVITTRGRHQISFGANYRRAILNSGQQSGQPVGVFVGVNSYIAGLYGIIPGATFNAKADFILGQPYVFTQSDAIYQDITANLFGVYAEDNFRLTDKLTATFGARWDPYLPYKVGGQRINCFVPGQQSKVYTNAPVGEVFPGDPSCPQNGIQASYEELQPRIGLAYQADQGKTAIRVGYGRYNLQSPLQPYTRFTGQPWVRSYYLQQPFLSIDNLWQSAGTTDPFASGFHGPDYAPPADTTFTPGLNLSTFDKNTHPGYIQQWSLSLQHLFTSTDSVEIAYNGTAGVHLPVVVSLNTPVFGPGAMASNEAARRPYPQFAIMSNSASIATSSYNGLDLTYKHQGKLVTINSVLTWSHAIDDASAPGFGSNVSLPSTDRNFRRGRSDFDQFIVSRTTGSWSLPDFKSYNSFVRTALGSWTTSGLLILDAGQPFSISDGGDFSYSGLGIDYADRVPNQPAFLNGRLNIKAFTDNAPGTFGNSGRNAYRGPAFLDLDVALLKNFPIKDRFTGTFRAEGFNVVNHANYFPPNASYSSTAQSTFGTYTNARDPRILQFSVKLQF